MEPIIKSDRMRYWARIISTLNLTVVTKICKVLQVRSKATGKALLEWQDVSKQTIKKNNHYPRSLLEEAMELPVKVLMLLKKSLRPLLRLRACSRVWDLAMEGLLSILRH